MSVMDAKYGKLRVLSLEDNPNDSELIQAQLETAWEVVELLRVETREGFIRALNEFAPDVVLSDFNLPDMNGSEALQIVRETHPSIPVVMVTGALGDIEAVELVKLGARDYVMKDHMQRLTSAVQGALSQELGIRARKAAEKALRQSEEEIRELVEHSPIAMIVDVGAADDEKVMLMNRRFTELFGYTIADVHDELHWWPLAYPDEQYRVEIKTEWTARVGKAIQEHGEIEPMESRVVCKDGSIRYVRVSFASIGSRNIITFEDMTRRKTLEDALMEAADRNRAITETANDAVVCIDSAGYVSLWNRKAEGMFGYTAAEAFGRNLHELITPQHYREQAIQAMRHFAQTGSGPIVGSTRQLDARRKDGSEFPVELSVSAMNIHGEWHATGIIRDITERKQAEAKIEKLNKLYETLSLCNQAIVRSTSEAELLARVCAAVVKFGSFRMAWIGWVDPASSMVIPTASDGKGADEYLSDIKVSIDVVSEYGQGPTGTAIREDKPFWCEDFLGVSFTGPWRERAAVQGWRSSASLPLHRDGVAVGAFTMYADEPYVFEEDVRELLIEMAQDIDYALDNFSHEAKREQAEVNLRLMAGRAEAMLELPLAAESMSEVDFMQRGQELAEDLTGSQIAFIHFVNDDEESLDLIAWSRRTLETYCTASFDRHYPVSKAGIWADALRRRAAVVFNDYENSSGKHGLPEGHAELRRLVSVPVIENGKVVMLTGVGNKATDYTEIDVETVQLISEEIWRIVQQRRSREALRQSEHNYRMLTEQVPAIIYRASLDKGRGSMDFISAAVDKLGYSSEEWIANSGLWESLIHPDDRENVYTLLEQMLSGGGKFSAEYRLRAASGEWRYLQDEAQIIRDEEGRELYLQGVMLDITHRRQAEESLRKLSQAVEQSPSSIVITDLDARLEYVNEAFVKATGYSREEAIGQNPRLLHSGKTPRAVHDDMWAHLARGETWRGEMINRRKDGSEYVESILASPVRDAEGRISHYLGIKDDITERKRVEQALFESEQTFRVMTASAQDAIVIIDNGGNVSFWNAAAEKIFGYTVDEIIGRDLHQFLTPPRYREAYLAGFSHFRQTGEGNVVGKTLELASLHKDGHEFPVELSLSAVNIAGEWQAIGIMRDITERKRIEEQVVAQYEHVAGINTQLVEANKQLEQARSQLLQSEKMAAIGVLAAGVAHEINNPVGYVNSNLGTLDKYLADIFVILDKYEAADVLLDADNPLLNEVRQFKARIDFNYLRTDIKALIAESHHGLERVKKIILDLKDFSHSDAEENWGWANVHHGLDTTLNVVWNELKYKCEVVKEYGELPDIFCLPSQLNQVFMNLLVNAAQAIDVRGKITIRTGAEGEQIWVEVSDTGHGIPPEIIPRLFEPFFTTKPVGKGTGLGLSVSYNIVEKHHGQIEVHSEVGKGSTFRVWLPVHQSDKKEKA